MLPLAALRDRRLTYRTLTVLGALCSFRQGSDDVSIVAGRDEIAERCRLHQSVISSATSELEKLGWVEKVGRGGRSVKTTYRLTTPKTVADSATVTQPETVTESVSKTVADSATRLYRTEFTERETRAPKGGRLPHDWKLPDDYREWAVTNLGWSTSQANEVAECFSDYWHSATGKNATKADWFATWRNWCRRERPAGSQPGTHSKNSIFAGAL